MQVPAGSVAQAEAVVAEQAAQLRAEYGQLERGLSVEARPAPADAAPAGALAPEGAERLLTLLLTLPHGVLKNSHAMAGARQAGLACASLWTLGRGEGARLAEQRGLRLGEMGWPAAQLANSPALLLPAGKHSCSGG